MLSISHIPRKIGNCRNNVIKKFSGKKISHATYLLVLLRLHDFASISRSISQNSIECFQEKMVTAAMLYISPGGSLCIQLS